MNTLRDSNIIHLTERNPLRSVARLHGPERKKDHASFSSRSALKFAQLFNAMVEIAKSFTFFLICLFGGLVITSVALSPFIYWKFFSLH